MVKTNISIGQQVQLDLCSIICRVSMTNNNHGGQGDVQNSNNISDTGLPELVPQKNLFNQDKTGGEHVSQSGTTVNIADGETSQITMSQHIELDSIITDMASTGYYQDVIAFLQKPVPVLTGTLGTTDTVSTFSSLTMPSTLIRKTVFNDKLKGFMAIRADMVFTLQVNGNRFQQGRYLLNFVPTCGMESTSAQAVQWYNMHMHTLAQRTQTPHAELDIACDTEVVLRVPFVSAYSHCPIDKTGSETRCDTGFLSLTPYSALVAPAGSTTASFTIWGHFENVKLGGPTVPQSGRMFPGKKAGSHSEREAKAAGIGPIQSTATSISKAAGVLSQVPFLSNIAAPVSWAADIVGGVASIFGLSRPTQLEPAHRMHRNVFAYVGSIDGPDSSLPLSSSVKNSVELVPGFAGTDIDELSIRHFASIPSWYLTNTWSTSDTSGTLLHGKSLYPGNFFVSGTAVGGQVTYNPTPVTFLSNIFGLYRGSVTVRIKLVKTEFHSGRLIVAFNPYVPESVPNPPTITLDTTSYTHREIIDIRQGNEFTFTFPFTSTTLYKPTSGNNSQYGYMAIYVLDALVAPSTVSSSVTLLYEVLGGPDLEFAKVESFTSGPTVGVVPQSGRMFQDFRNHSPDAGSNPCALFSGTIGASKVLDAGLLPARVAIGESVQSLRSLLRATNFVPTDSALTVTARYYNFYPFAISAVNSNTATTIKANTYADFYSLMGSMFALSRGGVRLRLIDMGQRDNKTMVSYNQTLRTGAITDFVVPSATDSRGFSSLLVRYSTPFAIQQYAADGGVEVNVPMYSRFIARPSAASLVAPTNGTLTVQPTISGDDPVDLNSICVDFRTAPTETPVFMRCGSDDNNFGLFVSIPPMLSIGNIL